MARPKPAPVPASPVAYVVKGDGWIGSTYRKDGEVIYLTEAAARTLSMAYRIELKSDVDARAAAPAPQSPASPVAAPAAVSVADPTIAPVSDHASDANEHSES